MFKERQQKNYIIPLLKSVYADKVAEKHISQYNT